MMETERVNFFYEEILDSHKYMDVVIDRSSDGKDLCDTI